jgi:hypothetical protein
MVARYSDGMHKTTIYLADDLVAGLADLAARTGKPQAELVRRAISDLLEANKRPPLSWIGMADSPPPPGYPADPSDAQDWLKQRWSKHLDRKAGGDAQKEAS